MLLSGIHANYGAATLFASIHRVLVSEFARLYFAETCPVRGAEYSHDLPATRCLAASTKSVSVPPFLLGSTSTWQIRYGTAASSNPAAGNVAPRMPDQSTSAAHPCL